MDEHFRGTVVQFAVLLGQQQHIRARTIEEMWQASNETIQGHAQETDSHPARSMPLTQVVGEEKGDQNLTDIVANREDSTSLTWDSIEFLYGRDAATEVGEAADYQTTSHTVDNYERILSCQELQEGAFEHRVTTQSILEHWIRPVK